MAFTDQQLSALRRGVSPQRIRRRTAQHKEFRYIEGWFAIAEANRIFGFDGWDRETVESKCIQARDGRGGCHAIYSARVSITVRTPAGPVVRDGLGSGEGRGGRLAEAHDIALKAAKTDATKRALITFGRAFGLTLYSDRRPKGRAESSKPNSPSNGAASPRNARAAIAEAVLPRRRFPRDRTAPASTRASSRSVNRAAFRTRII
jgi:recombination DNA repair RAD52 pathway protein